MFLQFHRWADRINKDFFTPDGDIARIHSLADNQLSSLASALRHHDILVPAGFTYSLVLRYISWSTGLWWTIWEERNS